MERVLDIDLVGRAQAGDERAFTSLLRPLVGSAYRLAGAMLHDSHAAEDVVQEASLKAWRKLHQLRPGTEMKPWFLGIVANECREMRRARWWSVLKVADPEPTPTPGIDPVASFGDLRSAIRRLTTGALEVSAVSDHAPLVIERSIAGNTQAIAHTVIAREI